MDYFGILKRAWEITWRYKALWILGLFVGASSGGSSYGSSSSSSNSSSDYGDYGTQIADSLNRWVTDNLALVVVLVVLLVFFALAWAVVALAAQGGLVHAVNRAAEGETPSLREAWRVGFSKWGRVFMTQLVVTLPYVLVVAVFLALMTGMGVFGARSALAGDDGSGMAAFAGGMCCLLPVMLVVLVAGALIMGIVYSLALRYGVLCDITFGKAIVRAWNDLWAKKGAFVFLLVMYLPAIAYGLALMIFLMIFLVPAAIAFFAEQVVVAVALLVLAMLVSLVPGSIYSTFNSASWTIFFRQMTGMELQGHATPVPQGGYYAETPAVDPPASDDPADRTLAQ